MTFLEKLLLLAVVAQVLLTIAILLLLGRERIPPVMSGEIPMSDIAVDRSAYPLRARLFANSFDNQFQLPVLFYVAVLLALWAGGVSWGDVVLAWLFVALRCIHAIIHTTTNHLLPRFSAYTAGLVVLVLFWLWLVLRLIVLVPNV
jgi:hypothetical protein